MKVIIYEITNEYSYSNPTGFFNLSLPHLELRTNNYSTLSYAQYKKIQAEGVIAARREASEGVELSDEEETTQESNQDGTNIEPNNLGKGNP